jgi:tRNA U34 5-methylaminomethyl-2-thiouridine-forming methyltransferase MnmC
VQALIERSAAAQPADRPAPRAFAEWRSHIANPPAGASTPGELARAALAADDAGVVGDVGRAVAMVRDQSIGPWPPPNETLSEIVKRLGEMAEGVVVVSAAAKQEQLDRELDEAVDRVFDAGFAGCTANRFEESAYIFWRREALEDARACLAAANAFRGSKAEFGELGRAMLEVVLAPALKSIEQPPEKTESSDEPSMVSP